MDLSLNDILYIIGAIMLVNILLISLIILNKYKHKARQKKLKKMDQYIIQGILDTTNFPLRQSRDIALLVDRFGALKQRLTINPASAKNFYAIVNKHQVISHFTRRTCSYFKHRRIEAAVYLGIIGTDDARQALEIALKNETDYSVKLYIINSLVDIGNTDSIDKIIASILAAPRWYRDKAQGLLYEYDHAVSSSITALAGTNEPVINEMIVNFANRTRLGELRPYLQEIIKNPVTETALLHQAVQALVKISPADLDNNDYLHHADPFIRALAIETLANHPSDKTVLRLTAMLNDETSKGPAILALSRILAEKPQQIRLLTAKFLAESDPAAKSSLAEIIGNRIEYLLLKLGGKERVASGIIIKEVILMGKNSNVIGFLNKNRDIELENELLALLKAALSEKTELQAEFCTYLDDRLLKKCNLSRPLDKSSKKEEVKDRKVITILYSLLAGIFLVFPAAYLLIHHDILLTIPWNEKLKLYIIDFNYYLVYYATTVNFIYLFILAFSLIGVIQQSRYWQLKKITFLFKKGIMPSISIIAPAFNEEATIIESANSLLNLKYPDYELIIVNDGSKDNTLRTLTQYFNLEKVDIDVVQQLDTKPLRGIYRSKSMPKLTVVDKANGGKADSLNMGINVAKNDYFCGIDADSLLETEALLKLTSQMVDQTVECPAMGGNIFPINGCTVDKGLLLKLQIPHNHIARLQTIEYIRAFMAGRVGWAYLDCLLIISGAFGLFKKDRIIEIGGYLTSSGKYQKDTVGEDMELVVRLNKHMLKKKIPFKINYAFNANCWTEVPESYTVLKRQRDRWHRGLIDILTFHRDLIGNIRYRKVGLIAFPYFFIFEMLGPLIEIQGYIMVVLAAFFGLLNVNIALLLFIATILLGILISLASLYMAERETDYFKLSELTILILYAFIENLGPRQLISLWRVSGYINSLKKPKGWGKMERKGFAGTAGTSPTTLK